MKNIGTAALLLAGALAIPFAVATKGADYFENQGTEAAQTLAGSVPSQTPPKNNTDGLPNNNGDLPNDYGLPDYDAGPRQ